MYTLNHTADGPRRARTKKIVFRRLPAGERTSYYKFALFQKNQQVAKAYLNKKAINDKLGWVVMFEDKDLGDINGEIEFTMYQNKPSFHEVLPKICDIAKEFIDAER